MIHTIPRQKNEFYKIEYFGAKWGFFSLLTSFQFSVEICSKILSSLHWRKKWESSPYPEPMCGLLWRNPPVIIGTNEFLFTFLYISWEVLQLQKSSFFTLLFNCTWKKVLSLPWSCMYTDTDIPLYKHINTHSLHKLKINERMPKHNLFVPHLNQNKIITNILYKGFLNRNRSVK